MSTNLRGPLLVAFPLLFALGCSCEEVEETAEEAGNKPPAPLKEKSVPSSIEAQIHPVVGATDARPVTLVLSSSGELCQAAVAGLGRRSHVVCSDAEPAQAEKKMKAALTFLKKAYPRHVAPPPVAFLADEARSEFGWTLMLKEPGFFSRAYLPGLRRKVLTATTLAALYQKSAKLLIVQGKEDERLRFLASSAARRGLRLVAAEGPSGSEKKAMELILGSDERL